MIAPALVIEARLEAQRILVVKQDGVIGGITLKAMARLGALAPTTLWIGVTADQVRKEMQRLLHVAEDGVFGRLTKQAWELLCRLPESAPWPGEAPQPGADGWHAVMASSFADPADIRAFAACKRTGKTDKTCFAVGDNGIGKWGDDCTAPRPMCALPPELWVEFGDQARGKIVEIEGLGLAFECEQRDTMPHLPNITNGAGIDLNPAAVAKLGKQPPLMAPVKWRWK